MLNPFKHSFLLWLFGAFVFVIILIRCFTIPPFVDEIINLQYYVRPGQFIPFFSPLDANNHLVSTALNYVSYQIFGSNVFFMRVFEALGFVLMFTYLMKLRTFFRSVVVANCFVISLTSCFFIVSYFSLARGYGLSIAFLIAAIYYLLRMFTADQKKTDSLKLGLLISLAVWTNLALLLTACIILAIASWLIFFQRNNTLDRTQKIRRFLYLFMSGIIPIFFAILFSFELKNAGALWIGGKTGFIQDVVLNLIFETFGDKGIWYAFVISLAGLIFLIFNIRKIELTHTIKISSALFFGTILGTIFLHLLLGINYPQNRAGIHFVVLGIVFSFFVFDTVKNRWHYLAAVPAGVMLFHFFLNINLSYSTTWKKYNVQKEIYDVVVEKQKSSPELLTMSGPYFIRTVFEYYSFQEPATLNLIQWKGYPSPIADLVFVTVEDKIENLLPFDTLWHNPISEMTILERRDKLEWQHLSAHTYDPFTTTQNELTLFEFSFTLENYIAIKSDLHLLLSCKNEVLHDEIHFVLTDSLQEELISEKIELGLLYEDYSSPVDIHKAPCFGPLEPGVYTFSVYMTIENSNVWDFTKAELFMYQFH